MYFKVNIILIILSYQYINVLASDYVAGIPGRYNCYVKMPLVDVGYMPVPFQGNVTRPEILQPDYEGNYLFTHNTLIKLSCTGSHFTSPTKVHTEEINVLCLNGFILYRNRPTQITSFKCKHVPRPSMKLTRISCQNSANTSVLEIGFQAKNFFLKSYRICFDIVTKKTLYTWYYVNSPAISFKQVPLLKPHFVETRIMDGMNLAAVYEFDTQKKMFEENFNLTYSNKTVEQIYENSFLIPGQLLSPDEFTYVSEQHTTYFYENTVPMWTKFHSRVWKLLQKLFKRNLVRGTARHMVAAGTFGLSEFKDDSGAGYPMYLASYDRIPVPEYIWKLDYDIDRRSGTVFIGYNHPYMPKNTNDTLCESVPCPGHFERESTQDYVFCCTKESFEKTFGPFDMYMYRPF